MLVKENQDPQCVMAPCYRVLLGFKKSNYAMFSLAKRCFVLLSNKFNIHEFVLHHDTKGIVLAHKKITFQNSNHIKTYFGFYLPIWQMKENVLPLHTMDRTWSSLSFVARILLFSHLSRSFAFLRKQTLVLVQVYFVVVHQRQHSFSYMGGASQGAIDVQGTHYSSTRVNVLFPHLNHTKGKNNPSFNTPQINHMQDNHGCSKCKWF